MAAVPSSGQLSMSVIADSVGMLSTNRSLRECTLITAVGGYYDPQWFGSPYEMSSFYGWQGYGYRYSAVPFGNYFDFACNGLYTNTTSQITDLSGQNLHGYFVTGTGNGTTITCDQYTTSFPGYLTIPGDSNQKSVYLNNSIKFGGTQNYTVITWFRVTSFTSNYPGIVGAEGRSSGSQPIGWSLYIDNVSGYHINHTRYSGTSGTGQNVQLTFGAGGIPTFAFDTWYMVTATFDGSVMGLTLHTAGQRFQVTSSNSYSLATSTSWGAFLGLRYNNWFNGRIGYFAVYGSPLLSTWLDTIYESTRIRYGV
jgi:hypothetical protein